MAVPFADPDDVANRWRPLSDNETNMANAFLDDASLMIRAQYPGIDGEVDTGAVDPDILRSVTANMVKRAMIGIATAGASQASSTVGPFSQSVTYSNPTGNLYITAVEDTFIRGYRPAGTSVKYGNTTTQCGGDGYFSTIYGVP
jgi:hypothetical protein